MRRVITAFAFALGTMAIAIHAQDTTVKSTTTVKADGAQTVTYTGCVHTGTEARSYTLDKVVPMSRTTTTDPVGTSGIATTTTSTTYALIPGDKVTVQEYVGHKVEVTGLLIPAGEKVKTETTTKVDRDDAKDTKTTDKSKSDKMDVPQFRVTSIKNLADRCE